MLKLNVDLKTDEYLGWFVNNRKLTAKIIELKKLTK